VSNKNTTHLGGYIAGERMRDLFAFSFPLGMKTKVPLRPAAAGNAQPRCILGLQIPPSKYHTK